jgi:hypothetical protein
MVRFSWVLAGIVAGGVSTAALAFQESAGGVANGQQPPSPTAPAPTGAGLDLKDTGTSVDPAAGGVEVRIPGLGKLGVLPKFDFGLELLYGVNEQRDGQAQQQGAPGVPADDVQIRGSLKHRF